jgi:hypothetical protein
MSPSKSWFGTGTSIKSDGVKILGPLSEHQIFHFSVQDQIMYLLMLVRLRHCSVLLVIYRQDL